MSSGKYLTEVPEELAASTITFLEIQEFLVTVLINMASYPTRFESL